MGSTLAIEIRQYYTIVFDFLSSESVTRFQHTICRLRAHSQGCFFLGQECSHPTGGMTDLIFL